MERWLTPFFGLKARQHEAQGFSPVLRRPARDSGLKGRQRILFGRSLATLQAAHFVIIGSQG
jgi:hypothetical protein